MTAAPATKLQKTLVPELEFRHYIDIITAADGMWVPIDSKLGDGASTLRRVTAIVTYRIPESLFCFVTAHYGWSQIPQDPGQVLQTRFQVQ